MAKKTNKGYSGLAVASDDDWQAEEDARTLLRAADIRGDAKRLKKAKAWAQSRAAELKNITSITD